MIPRCQGHMLSDCFGERRAEADESANVDARAPFFHVSLRAAERVCRGLGVFLCHLVGNRLESQVRFSTQHHSHDMPGLVLLVAGARAANHRLARFQAPSG
jgi:hypothetical protein